MQHGRRIRQDSKAAAADAGTIVFLEVEIECGLTFAGLARSARPNDSEKIERNLRNAQKAYDTVLRFRDRIVVEESTAVKLEAGLTRLKNILDAAKHGVAT